MKKTHPSLKAILVMTTFFLTAIDLSAQAPSLGTAANFGVLGGSTVTNTGATTVLGDLGVSPGSAITGFPPGIVVGTTHAADAVALQAQTDITAAFNALAGLPCDTVLTGQDLGGLTLTAGVYCFATSAQLTGTLTLDAQGDPNAEFIFQTGSTLTTASNSIVRVINGGNNCNIFWQVGSSATLGTATAFAGNILAQASITLTTGSNAAGRLFARDGAVTMDTNSVAVCPACSPISLSPATLPNGVIGSAYNQVITASGGTAPYTFTRVSGSLPPGLTLSPAGTLSGVPTTGGSFTFTVRATDAGGCFGSRIYTIAVNAAACPTITISPSTIPAAIAGSPYGPVNLTGSGGAAPYTFGITAGALPPGLALTPSGTISGIPTQSGSFTVTITATDSNGCRGSRIYTALVNCPTVTVSPATLPNGTVGTVYGPVALSASGGTAPYTFLVVTGSLPPGLTLSAAGSLSGTPTTAGSSTFTVRATDSAGCLGERIYTLIINPVGCPTITVNPATLPAGTAGTPYSQTITATGGAAPYTFTRTAGTLPPGLTLSTAGVLSGTPTRSGGFRFTVTARDTNGCLGSRVYNVVVACPIISLAPATLSGGAVGLAYSQTITASGGAAPYTFRVTAGALAPGLTLSTGGTISGTPLSGGNFPVTITATDAGGCAGARAFSIAVSGVAIPALDFVGLTLLMSLMAAVGFFMLKRS